MAAKIPPSNVIYTDTLQQNILSSFVIDDIDDVEVMNSIDSLKTKASPGLHGISAKSFKVSNTAVSPVLAKLFNKCLQEENFPDTLKQSQIIPVPKINSPTALTDFRPISLLPTISKIFEKILYNRMINYLTKYKILSPCQYGFLTNHSTESAITSIYDQLLNNLNEK